MKKILRERRRLLKYYLKSAKTRLSRQYWIARLDEVNKIAQEIKRKT